jgi:hypothetical protein
MAGPSGTVIFFECLQRLPATSWGHLARGRPRGVVPPELTAHVVLQQSAQAAPRRHSDTGFGGTEV